MDVEEKYNRKNPKETANPISQLFFWWIFGLFWKGAHRDLQESDLYDPLKSDRSEKLADHLERYWNIELKKLKGLEYSVGKDGKKKTGPRPRLYKALLRAFGPQYFAIGILVFIQAAILKTAQPVFQGWVIQYFDTKSNGEDISEQDALLYAGYLLLCTLGTVVIMQHTNLIQQQIGMRIRVACSSLVYRKILRLSRTALTQTTAGQIVNLLSNDTSRFDQLTLCLNYIWITPLQLIIVGYVMWQDIGIVTLVAIGSVLILTFPLHSVLTVVSQKLRKAIAPLTDRRVELMNELIAGIQVIKMYAWEIPFEKIVSNTRAAEMIKITWTSHVRSIYLAVIVFTERTTLYITLVAYVLMGNTIKPEITYVLTTYFNILQLTTALFFPQAIILAGETMVSVKRLEQFLLLDEVTTLSVESKPDNEEKKEKKQIVKQTFKERYTMNKIDEVDFRKNDMDVLRQTEKDSVSVTLYRVSANWVNGKLPPTLCDVSMNIKKGQLCALVGPVGSGKSSLLQTLLRELPLGAGTLTILQNDTGQLSAETRGYHTDNPNLRISYASQEPWLFNGSVRDNILFGQPFDKTRYTAVTRACALLKDFRQLPQGDMTLLSERGLSLSGGQRARINLARAVYQEADLYLLDDPLSAVDTRVARHLFKKCIEEYLAGKTRILVTHQLQFLKRADVVNVLDRGTVKMQGSFQELSQTGQELTNLLNRIKTDEETKREEENRRRESAISNAERRISGRRLSRKMSVKSVKSEDSSVADSEDNDYGSVADSEGEISASGQLSSTVYKRYFRRGGSYLCLFLLLLTFVSSQIATSGTDYWVSYWNNIETIRQSDSISNNSTNAQYNKYRNDPFLSRIFTLDNEGLISTKSSVYVYTFCILICIALTLIRSVFFMHICMIASRNIHNSMFYNILRGTMRFFHLNPSGRILNRFSKDVGAMDEILPKAMLEAIQVGLVILGILIMEVIVNVWMIIPLVVIAVLFITVRRFYLYTAQGVKRLEGVTKSPVFSHLNATLNGLPTIRSSGSEIQVLLRKRFDRLQDAHSGAWYLIIVTAVAFGFVLDLITCAFITCVCYTLLLLPTDQRFGGDVGLAISQSLIMTGTLQYGVRQSAEVISQMTSVERVLQYTDLPKEGPLTTNDPPPPDWPSSGRLVLKNVTMKYDTDDPPVLKDLNVTIEPGWKVGVVGRTGAGKSSLISALFRLFADGLEGEIRIDERDTSTLGLQDLRCRISIIPQEPVLFSESLRYNLDPFNKYEDAQLWDALREVELTDILLDQKIGQSGSNLSVGQRQLICLARAILRNNRILVMDEATANIDTRTDELIQETLRRKFANCTVITIAHRLNTIIDSDRIIVMEAGRIVEFGCPYELLRDKPDGHFSQMVQKTGNMMAENLLRQAEKACRKNNAQGSLELTHSYPSDSEIIATINTQYPS